MPLEIKVVLPIMEPLFSRYEEEMQFQNDALSELQSLPSISPIDPIFGEAKIHARVVRSPRDEPGLAVHWIDQKQVRSYRFLVFEIDGQACIDEIHRKSKFSASARFSSEEIVSLSQQAALNYLEQEVNSVMLVSNIARPGSLSAIEGFGFVAGNFCQRTELFNAESLFHAIGASQRLGWPKFACPSFDQTWNWIRRANVLVDGIGVGRLGRAVAAISNITTSNLEESRAIGLVWILLGLEALYSKGNTGLKEQLLGKTEAVLGPRTENRKAVGAVYDFRSRLLHGNVDIPLRFTQHDGVKKYEEFKDELGVNEEIALAVLLATLQWMAKSDVVDMSFDYALSTGTTPPAAF